MLEHALRNVRRYHDIVSVLIRNGLGFAIFEQMGLGGLGGRRLETEHDLRQLGQRITRALGQLGPTFMKMGQFASTRPDLIPKPIIKELERLQDRAPQIRFGDVLRTVEKELGAPVKTFFREFNPVPLGTASIGQVHYAELLSGEQVAVKVQRPGISRVVETDLEIIKNVLTLVEERFPKFRDYELQGLLREFSGWLEKELDYTLEGSNAERMAEALGQDTRVIIPRIFKELTTRHILTMDYVDGIKLNEHHKLADLNYDKRGIAVSISRALFQQILKDGFFHGDPHPGNIFVLPGRRIAFVDFGIVGNLDPVMKSSLAKLIGALTGRNLKSAVKVMLQLGVVSPKADLDGLRRDLERLSKKYLDAPIGQTDFSQFADDLSTMAFKHHITMPADFILLGKSLLILEGIVHELDPTMSIADLARSFRLQLIKERFPILKGVGKWGEKLVGRLERST